MLRIDLRCHTEQRLFNPSEAVCGALPTLAGCAMANLDRIVACLQEKVTCVLKSYYQSQNKVPSGLVCFILWLDALQIIGLGLLASQETVVIESVGLLVVPPLSSGWMDPVTHGVLFWFAFA